MIIKLIVYGIAKDILGSSALDFTITDQSSIRELKDLLIKEFSDFDKLQSLKFAINEDYQDDTYIIQPNDEVVIIPPVSGG